MIKKTERTKPPVLSRIEYNSIQDKVYEQIRQVLMKGGFAPGQKVSSRKLAAQLGTSDMPVRSALGRLLAEGALVQNSNGTFSIPLISLIKFREVMTLRAMLEGEAAAQACGNIDQAGFQELRLCSEGLTRAIKVKDISEYLDYNQRLKFAIYRYSTSQTLQSLIRLMWLQSGPFLRHLSRGLDRISEVNFHEDAIEALAKDHRELARQAISKDILAGMAFLTIHGEFAPEQPRKSSQDVNDRDDSGNNDWSDSDADA